MPVVRFVDGEVVSVSNIFCIGRNYAAHAAELGNALEAEPVVFLKPTSALHEAGTPVVLPSFSGDVHHEVELVVVLGQGGKDIALADALSHVAGFAVGLDLTARDIQNINKPKGLPWTLAKGFDSAACLSEFVRAEQVSDVPNLQFWLDINGQRRQSGDCKMMIHSVASLISWLSSRFTLQAGDLIYTGTPEGVAALASGDSLEMGLADLVQAQLRIQ